MKFIDIPATTQRDFISQYSDKTNINPLAVEKDWWVSAVMRALFALPYADRMSFKGGIADRAFADKELFKAIVAHRRKFIGLKGFDYDTLSPETICIIPPDTVYNQWKDDYERMIQFMSYGEQPEFEDVIAYIKSLNDRLKTEL